MNRPELGPDLVLHGGQILTMDPSQPAVQAVAIHGDRIIAVGRDDTVLGLAGPRTGTVHLAGRTVIPGLNDSHHHLLNRAARAFHGIRLDQFTSVSEILAAIATKVRATGPGHVILSNAGNAAELLDEGRTPTLAELDAAAPANPVVLTFEDGLHVNTMAMKLSGVDSRSPAPAAGAIGRDDGALTGVFSGAAARLVHCGGTSTAIGDKGSFSAQESRQALLWAQRELNAVGITSLRNPALSRTEMNVYRSLRKEDALTVRIAMDLDVDHVGREVADIAEDLAAWDAHPFDGDAWLRLNGIGELWIDQSTDGMLLSEPYENLPLVALEDPSYQGIQRICGDKFAELMRVLGRLGWRPLVHAGGDRAIDLLLDAFEQVNEHTPLAGRRWVLDHAHYGMPRHIDRARQLGLVVAMQYHPYLYYPLFAHLHGTDRAVNVFPARSWLEAGIVVAGGSDHSKVPANLLEGVRFWTTRTTRKWGPIGTQHRITREQALRMLTRHGAYLTFEEDLKGTLAPGRLADLVVLSDAYLCVPDDELPDLTALMTMVGGQVVHQNPTFDVDVPVPLHR